jgi:hypothetical protein
MPALGAATDGTMLQLMEGAATECGVLPEPELKSKEVQLQLKTSYVEGGLHLGEAPSQLQKHEASAELRSFG